MTGGTVYAIIRFSEGKTRPPPGPAPNRLKMKRRIEIGLIVLLTAAGLLWLILSLRTVPPRSPAPFPAGDRMTVRNVTTEAIRYRIRPVDLSAGETEYEIKPGEIHSYSGKTSRDIFFSRKDAEATRRLEPGRPYSFRYDEKHLLQIYAGSHGRGDAADLAPFVSTPLNVVGRMLEMAELDAGDVLYDIGCGDGRIVIAAARDYGARGVGIDIDPERIRESRGAARKAGVGDRVRFVAGDAFRIDISEATVVTLYLLPESNELLRPKLERELRPGAVVISHNYRIPGWEDRETAAETVRDTLTGRDHTIFLYRK